MRPAGQWSEDHAGNPVFEIKSDIRHGADTPANLHFQPAFLHDLQKDPGVFAHTLYRAVEINHVDPGSARSLESPCGFQRTVCHLLSGGHFTLIQPHAGPVLISIAGKISITKPLL